MKEEKRKKQRGIHLRIVHTPGDRHWRHPNTYVSLCTPMTCRISLLFVEYEFQQFNYLTRFSETRRIWVFNTLPQDHDENGNSVERFVNWPQRKWIALSLSGSTKPDGLQFQTQASIDTMKSSRASTAIEHLTINHRSILPDFYVPNFNSAVGRRSLAGVYANRTYHMETIITALSWSKTDTWHSALVTIMIFCGLLLPSITSSSWSDGPRPGMPSQGR